MNSFNITIPTLPPFALSPTPGRAPRKRKILEECHSPTKHIQENIWGESSARAPLVPLEYPSQPCLSSSSSKRNNCSFNKLCSTPPPTPFSASMLPSTQTPEGTKKHCCWACHGEDIVEASFKSTPPRLDHLTCMEMALGILQAHGLTLGDFIMTRP